ncbi:hypothetical protein M3Y97_00110100 [Aphelenchoides bicaudatus]|nr:hypothetical protein M3Y97_00110100 [Aphelenchoides bicaudatus]
MHSHCLTNLCLCLLVVVCSMLEVRSYYVLARYDPENFGLRMSNSGFSSEDSDELEQRPLFPALARPHKHIKRSAANSKSMPPHEHVCEMKIRQNYQPKFGHEQNGSKIEIQQDDKRQFSATFVECEDNSRPACHGIDGLFSSECVTVYGLQPAGIRPEGSNGEFIEGLIKVPVACQCRLRRKLNQLVMADD